jgi:hypothetical protein
MMATLREEVKNRIKNYREWARKLKKVQSTLDELGLLDIEASRMSIYANEITLFDDNDPATVRGVATKLLEAID